MGTRGGLLRKPLIRLREFCCGGGGVRISTPDNQLLQPGCRSIARPLKTEPQVESARPIARNIDRSPDNSERQVLIQEPKYANRQITWGRVDCQSSIYLSTHVIQLPGYSTLDGTRTEQPPRRACPCAIPSGVIAENRRSKCPPITANQRLSNSQTHENVQSMRE